MEQMPNTTQLSPLESIQDENTALLAQHITVELARQGEALEFDPAPKIDRKKQYVQLEIATTIVEMYAKDLQQAYNTIARLEENLKVNQKALEEVTEAAKRSAQQVKKVLAGEQKFSKAETKLAELAASVEELRQSHAGDTALISQLKRQAEEAQELARTVPELAADVQFVLDALQNALAEEGLDVNEILDAAG